MSKKREILKTDLTMVAEDGLIGRNNMPNDTSNDSGHDIPRKLQKNTVDGATTLSNTSNRTFNTSEVGEPSGVKKGEQVELKNGKLSDNISESRVPFINLFRNNRMACVDNKLSFIDTGTETLKFGFDEIESIENTYGYCLLGYVIGGKPPTAALFDLIRRWGSNITFQTHASGWILFSFPSAEVRDRIFNGGNHMVFGFHLFLKEVPRCFRFCMEDMASLPVWVQLHGLPPDCWTTSILSKISSRIGVPIHMDSFTRIRKRLKFARVLVEIDVNRDRVEEMKIELPTGMVNINVVYEQNFSVCDICKRVGHAKERCLGLDESKYGAINTHPISVSQRYRSRSSLPRRNGHRGRSRRRPPKYPLQDVQPKQNPIAEGVNEIITGSLSPQRRVEFDIEDITCEQPHLAVINSRPCDVDALPGKSHLPAVTNLELPGVDAIRGKSHLTPSADNFVGDGGFITVTNKKSKKAKKKHQAKAVKGNSNFSESWQKFVGDLEEFGSSDTELIVDSPIKQEIRFFGKNDKGRQPKIASVRL